MQTLLDTSDQVLNTHERLSYAYFSVSTRDSDIACGDSAGDQVLEWNGRLLQGATFKEVYNIILESKPEPQVELVVSRPIG